MKHTPGPWRMSQAPGAWYKRRWVISSNIYSKPNITDGRDSVAQVFGNTEEEAKANGHLIIAAPELLKVCKEALKRVDELGGERGRVSKLIEQAIAKAEGKEAPHASNSHFRGSAD